jgi:hypothetical protein
MESTIKDLLETNNDNTVYQENCKYGYFIGRNRGKNGKYCSTYLVNIMPAAQWYNAWFDVGYTEALKVATSKEQDEEPNLFGLFDGYVTGYNESFKSTEELPNDIKYNDNFTIGFRDGWCERFVSWNAQHDGYDDGNTVGLHLATLEKSVLNECSH